jgi:hypothetical protein
MEVEEEKISDDELEKEIEQDLMKEINQSDKVDSQVSEQLKEMGFLWSRINEKLSEDKICFSCKKSLEKGDVMHILEAHGSVQPGCIPFVSICMECKNNAEQELKKQQGGEKENGKE